MDGPNWIERQDAIQIHEEQLAEHGGLPGIRDPNALESALARPKHLFHFGTNDYYALAASMGYSLACNHPFIDGNKRTALVATETFLAINWLPLLIESEVDRYTVFRAVASGYVQEEALTTIIKGRNQDDLPDIRDAVFADMQYAKEEISGFLQDAYAEWEERTIERLERLLTSE